MPAQLNEYLRRQLELKSWTPADLADTAGLPRTTVYNLFAKPHLTPELSTFIKLSTALEVPLITMLEAAGIQLVTNPEVIQEAQRLDLLLDTMPWLRETIATLVRLSPDDQHTVRSFAEYLASRSSPAP